MFGAFVEDKLFSFVPTRKMIVKTAPIPTQRYDSSSKDAAFYTKEDKSMRRENLCTQSEETSAERKLVKRL